MRAKLYNLWDSVTTGFWFIPSLMIVFAVGLAYGIMAVDKRVYVDVVNFGILYSGSAEGARVVLATIAGSLITVTSVAFSITVVSLTLAASQFGPRLLRNFMRDKGSQVVIGTFLSTFIYCLFVLRSIDTVGEHVFTPHLSVTFGMALALLDVGMLIYFVHHVAHSIHADNVIAAVHEDLQQNLQRLFPEKIGNESDETDAQHQTLREIHARYAVTATICSAETGYLQGVDSTDMMQLAQQHDLLIHVHNRPGHYVVAGNALCIVHCHSHPSDELCAKLAGIFIIGTVRTPEQDVEFSIHQLVEVAVRALSPGVNDPFTAMSCIDRLGSGICVLAERKMPLPYRYDDDGNLRVIAPALTFRGAVDAAFNQVRQYGRTCVAVNIRMLEALRIIALKTHSSARREALLRQANMIVTAIEAIHEPADQNDIKQRYQSFLEAL